MASQMIMINLPVLLSTEKLQTNKLNFPTYKVLMEEHSVSKGLRGYLNGTITKPAVVTTTTGTTPLDPAPIYSTSPSYEEWLYHDGV
ncbi:hypothetical protein GGX14DRAFT_418773, partial [Mycena pura]